MRTVGAVVRGIRTPIVREGDDLVTLVRDSVMAASETEHITFHDRDIVAVTESVVARAAGNYATVQNIADDVKAKFGCDHIGVIFPILSRNRFAIVLRGIATGMKKITLMLSYPSDEVGNHLFDEELLEDSGINPYSDVLTEEEYRKAFGYALHPFTGVDYVDYYKKLIEECGCEAEILFANQAEAVLTRVKNVLCCDIHTRFRTKRRLAKAGAEKVLALDDLLTASVNGSGYNEKYGLLGSNKSSEDKVKLFPRNGAEFVDALAAAMRKATGKNIECMIYGDGAFRDPVGKIWELADPVVSPACTAGLVGKPPGVDIPCRGADAAFGQDVDSLADVAQPPIVAAQVVLGFCHPPQGCRSQRQHGKSGHHASPAHRSHRLALRSYERQRRQGYAGRVHSGLLRHLRRREISK